MAKKVLSLSQGNIEKAVAVLTDAIKQVSTMEDEGDNVLSSNEANAEVISSSKIAEGGAGYVRGREEGREREKERETERRAVWSWKSEKDPSILCRDCFLSSRHHSCFSFLLGPEIILSRQPPNANDTAPVSKMVEEVAQTSPALEPTNAPVPEIEEELAQASAVPETVEAPASAHEEEAAKTDEIAPPAALKVVEEVAQPSAATPKPSHVVASAPSPAPQAGTGLIAPAKVDRASSGQVYIRIHDEPIPAPFGSSPNLNT